VRSYLLLAVLLLISPALAQDAATLAKGLEDGDMAKREAAATDLAKLGPEALPALTALLEATKDRGFKVRVAAIRALVAIGPKASEASHERLAELLRDKSAQVREEAARSLGLLGVAHKSLPELGGLFGDQKWRVRAAAVEAVGSTGQAAEPLYEELRSLATGDVSATVRKAAAAAFAKLEAALGGGASSTPAPTSSPKARWLGRPLAEIVKDLSKADARSSAFRELNAMGPLGASALPELLSLLADPDHAKMHFDLLYAIGRLGELGEGAVPALIKELKSSKNRMGAAEALGDIGPSAKAAVPALIEAWDSVPGGVVRGAIAAGFRGIGPASKPALERMKTAFPGDCEGFPNYLVALARAIAAVGPEGAKFLLAKAADPKLSAPARTAALVAAADCRGTEKLVAAAAWLSLKGETPEDWRRGSMALTKLGIWSPVALEGREVLETRHNIAGSPQARAMASVAAYFKKFDALHAVLKHDPKTEAAIPALLERLDQKDHLAYGLLETLAKRNTKAVEALMAHVGQKTEGWAYNLLCELTGLARGSQVPPMDTPAGSTEPAKGADLSHVKVGQVYSYTLEASGTKMQMNYIVETVDDTRVTYVTETIVAGNSAKSPAATWVIPQAKGGPQATPAPNVKTRFEAYEFEGESWEVQVVEANGTTTWIPLKGGVPTFPPFFKTESPSMKMKLVKLEQPKK
jgi:HEAT repeat protein